MIDFKLQAFLKNRTGLQESRINAAVMLFKDGATVPFIARYRKEKTKNLTEEELFLIEKEMNNFHKIVQRKITIEEAIKKQSRWNEFLANKIDNCWDEIQLEDIYAPYKTKRLTRAEKARKAGLETLAKKIMSQKYAIRNSELQNFISKDFPDIDAAKKGAQDIIAEWVAEDQKSKEFLRSNTRKYGILSASVIKSKKDEASKYKDYWDYQESLNRAPSHRVLAILRGDKEGVLRVKIGVDLERFIKNIERFRVKNNSIESSYVKEAIKDGVKRLMWPSIENQILQEVKDRAEEKAIEVFAKNLRQLLLSPPLNNVPVLAIDPGFRTGCKTTALSSQGDFLEYKTIFPHEPQNQEKTALRIINDMLESHSINHIAIGDGTAGRETYEWLKKELPSTLNLFTINEDGASIYSASEIAREEFPDLDLTVRGAISIGRRLQDPLSELVKIDPKSIGVGQYQHDVNPSALQTAVNNTVLSSVNQVGIDLNQASQYLLQFVSGLGPTLAKNIIAFRQHNNKFKSRQQLLDVPRLGPKAYEQAVGFLRIKDGYPLDNTGIHPENYTLLENVIHKNQWKIEHVLNNIELQMQLAEELDSMGVGKVTIKDILEELGKPGFDPRGKASAFSYDARVRKIEDLHPGMIIPGQVTNLTNFGAFVNIGIKENGLIHISQISDRRINDPSEVLHLKQAIEVEVLSLDMVRKRIQLKLITNKMKY